MEWVTTIAKAIDLIETELLSDELTLARICKGATISESHLQRAFSMLTGMSISDYIRRRRLTLAAQELATSDVRVIDMAFKYHYETPEAFNKAFKRQHGISPIEARKPGVTLNACTRLTIEITLKGAPSMNYKLIEKEAFYLVGKSITTTAENGENMEKIPMFWAESESNGTIEKLCQIEGMKHLVGACLMDDLSGKTFEYGICSLIEGSIPVESDEFMTYAVSPQTWAVFECVGAMPHAIQKVWHQIFAEWFPATGYEHAMAPELEVYPPGDSSSEDYYCEIWIPIVKK